MNKIVIWWRDYSGFILIPYIAFAIIVLTDYKNTPMTYFIIFLLFTVYVIGNFICFVIKELNGRELD